ncbi:ankyrin repeat domain-containing protein [Dyella psychrodurans]|nr:ankyrin repeat domain-containing protein [Dyella psychrodurans]
MDQPEPLTTTFWRAVQQGRSRAVRALAEEHPHLVHWFNVDRTALMEATSRGHNSVVEDLIALGADVDAHTPRDWTALHLGAFVGAVMPIRILLDAGADARRTNDDGHTPLIVAVRAGQEKVVQTLIQRGVDVHEADGWGSPLHHAIAKRQRAIAQRLINAGADRDARDALHRTARDRARDVGWSFDYDQHMTL